jgi:predicted nucleic acid-binding protein
MNPKRVARRSLDTNALLWLMRRLGTTEVISFDTEFDRIPGISRLEP